MEMPEVHAKYEGGKATVEVPEFAAKLEIDVMKLVGSKMDALIEAVKSGQIDLIKGTDLDKEVAVKVLEFAKEQLSK